MRSFHTLPAGAPENAAPNRDGCISATPPLRFMLTRRPVVSNAERSRAVSRVRMASKTLCTVASTASRSEVCAWAMHGIAAAAIAARSLIRMGRLSLKNCNLGLQPAPVGEPRRRRERRTGLEHDVGVRLELDRLGIARVRLAVHPHTKPLAFAGVRGPGLRVAQRLSPDLEEVAEREGAIRRRL